MTIDLTDADRAEIQRICNDDRIDHDPYDVDIALYRAGLAAGRARTLEEAAQVCEARRSRNKGGR